MDETNSDQHEVHRVKRGRKPKTVEVMPLAPSVNEHAQNLALRIWQGQSPDLPLIERVARVKNGLAARGWDMDGVELPAEDWQRYA